MGHRHPGARRPSRRGAQGARDPRAARGGRHRAGPAVKALRVLQGEFLESLLRDDEAPPRVAIYRRNVLAALSGALEAAYPVTLRLVGAAFFLEAARTFARATPSTSGDLHAYGGEFPEFLSGYSPARALDYLAHVPRLESPGHDRSLAADAPGFEFQTLAP